ncbi:hypothetical protein MY10362_006462 [Beauveria mimosiformis]
MAGQPWPDGRFIWNLANEALYSELHLSPGVPIITAILLNVGGRPTTSLVGNGVLLASAVSIAHSLGLNHDPTDWNIPESEKRLRMSIWWALLVQDKCLAHGTPPRVAPSQHNVPFPTRQHLCQPGLSAKESSAASIFAALVGLTSVLDTCLGNLYNIEQQQSMGASNLRLAYLSMRLLLQRTQLEAMKQDSGSSSEEQLLNSALQGRQLAEEILLFTQHLQPIQLNDFWMPVAAFIYPSTINFLLRHALETESSVTGLAQTFSFQLARQLIDILRLHKEAHGWDMGDVCLAQHAEIIDRVLANVLAQESHHGAVEMMNLHDFVMPDAFILDGFFPICAVLVQFSEGGGKNLPAENYAASMQVPSQGQANLPASTLAQQDNTPPTLYQSEQQDALIKKSQSYLLGFGSAIHDEMVTGTAGLYFYTASGSRLLDWTSGQMSCLLGHGHPEIVKVIVDHAMHLDHTFSGMVSPPVVHLAERLCRMLPEGLDRAMFLSTGGESNEAAIKLAKVCTGKFEVVGLGASWHGVTAQAVGAQFHFGRSGHGPLMPGTMMLPAPDGYRSVFRNADDGSYDWEAELDYGWRMIDLQSCGSLACCIVECIQSSGGMHVLPPGYLAALKRHCEKRGMLLIVDEAQTGVGRCGDLMAINHEQVVPDILTLSKTLGNGLPLSAVVTSEQLHRVSQERNFFFYTTHLNDPLVAAVGNKVLEIVDRDDDVRGRGLMAGVEIVADRESKTPGHDLARRIGDCAFEHGLWANLSSHPSFGGVLRIAPPITVTAEQIEQGLEILERAFAETEGSQPLYAD